jgi:hypothetical protein
MAITADPLNPASTHHIRLYRGVDEVGLILCDGAGNLNERGITRRPYPSSATVKMYEGEKDYSDSEPPFSPKAQKDWSGGRGQLNLDDDAARYLDGSRVAAWEAGKLYLGPQEVWSEGYREMVQAMPGSVTAKVLYGTTRYMARSFTAVTRSSSGVLVAKEIWMWVRKVGMPGDLTAALYTDVAGTPGFLLGSASLTPATVDDSLYILYQFTLAAAVNLTHGTSYFVVIYSDSILDDAVNHWEVGVDTTVACFRTTAPGIGWTATTGGPYYRVTDTKKTMTPLFFEYKGALHFIPRYDDNDTWKIYREGYRGIADDNTGNLGRLYDANQPDFQTKWTAQWRVKIYDGEGVSEADNWRKVVGGGIDGLIPYLTVGPRWNIVHDPAFADATQYIVTGTNLWNYVDEQMSISGTVMDVAVAGELVYLAFGEHKYGHGVVPLWKYHEYTDGVDWLWEAEQENGAQASFLQTIYDPAVGWTIYLGRNNDADDEVAVIAAIAAQTIDSALVTEVPYRSAVQSGFMADLQESHTDTASDSFDRADGALGNTDSNGPMFFKNAPGAPSAWGLMQDGIGHNAGIEIKDNKASGKALTNPSLVYWNNAPGGANTFTNMTNAYDGNLATNYALTLTSDDYIYVGVDAAMLALTHNIIRVYLGATVNGNAATMSAQYWNGAAWTALADWVDGTNVGGKTLATSGNMTWTAPGDWTANVVNGQNRYWMRLKASANLTAAINIQEMYILWDPNRPYGAYVASTEDCSVEAEITIASGQWAGVMARRADDQNYLYARIIGTNIISLYKVVAGTHTQVKIAACTYVAGRAMRLEVVGTRARVYYGRDNQGRWIQYLTDYTITDAGLLSGTDAGLIGGASKDIQWDDFLTYDTAHLVVNKGSGVAEITVGPSLGVAIAATDQITVADWRNYKKLKIEITSTKNMAAGELQLLIDDTLLCGSPIATIDFPAMEANFPYVYYGATAMELLFDLHAVAGGEAVIATGLNLTIAPADVYKITVKFWYLCPDEENRTMRVGDRADRITGLERYGDPETLWVFKQGGLWELANKVLHQIPLRELEAVRTWETGRGHCVHDVYLIFSLGEGVERYYRSNLDDIGPNRDQGLPSERRGKIAHMVNFPTGVFAALDGGEGNYSSILFWNEKGWHEVYRGNAVGMRIRRLHMQTIPGSETARLWFGCGSDVLWLPVSLNARVDNDYRYHFEGALVTSIFALGRQELDKFFARLKLVSQELTSTGINVEVQYRTDTYDDNPKSLGAKPWKSLPTLFTTSPSQKVNIATENNISGKWIQFRLILRTNNNTKSPEILSLVLDSILQEDVNWAYDLMFRLKDNDLDLNGEYDGIEASAKIAALDGWTMDCLPVTMESRFENFDGKTVKPQPLSFSHWKQEVEGEKHETIEIGRITLLGI